MERIKQCPYCMNQVHDRKKYCSDRCKHIFNSIKRDKEKGLAPARKRNRNWFYMVTGSMHNSLRGHGGRSGKGAMAARVEMTVEELVEFNFENVVKHFNGIPRYIPTSIVFGNHERISKEEAFKLLQ